MGTRVQNRSRTASGSTGMCRAGDGFGAGMELLEARMVLAAVSWDGGGGNGLWSNALNWSGDAVPGFADDVTIDVAGVQRLVVADSGPIRVRSLTLDDTLIVNSGVTLSVLQSFTLDDDADLRINGLVNWSMGVWDTGRPVLVQPGGRLNIGSSANPDTGSVTLRSTLDNRGLLAWQGGGILMASTGVVLNNTGKRFDIATELEMSPEAVEGGLVVNSGVIRRGGGSAGASIIDVDFTNAASGRVSVLRGSLQLGVETDGIEREMSNAGSMFVADGRLEFQNSVTHTDASFAGGEISFYAGIHALEGQISFGAGDMRLEGESGIAVEEGESATLLGTLRSFGRPVGLSGTLEVDGLLVLFGQPLGGRLPVIGGGTLNIGGRVVWANARVEVAVNIEEGGELGMQSLGDGNGSLLRSVITNLGVIDYAAGFLTSDTDGRIDNSGIVRKSGDGEATIGVPLAMVQGASGTPEVEVLGGTLTVQNAGFEHVGVLDVQAGTLHFNLVTGMLTNTGVIVVGPEATLQVTGNMENAGTMRVQATAASFGVISISQTLTITSGPLRINFLGGGFAAGQELAVITAGTRNGTFSGFFYTGFGAGLAASAQYLAGGVVVLTEAT